MNLKLVCSFSYFVEASVLFFFLPVCLSNYGPDGLKLQFLVPDSHEIEHGHGQEYGHGQEHGHEHNLSCREVLVQDCKVIPITKCEPNSVKSACNYKPQRKCQTTTQEVCKEVMGSQGCRKEERCGDNCSCSDKLCPSSVRQKCLKIKEEQCNTKCEKVCREEHYEQNCEYKPHEDCVWVEKEECQAVQELREVCETVYEEVCQMKGNEACTEVQDVEWKHEDVCEIEWKEVCETNYNDDCWIEGCEEKCDETGSEHLCEDVEEQVCETIYDKVCISHYGRQKCDETPRQECKPYWRNVCTDVKLSVCRFHPNKVCSPKAETTCRNVAVPRCSSRKVNNPVQKITCSYYEETCKQVARDKCSLQPAAPPCLEGKKGSENCRMENVCESIPSTECHQESGEVCEDVMMEICSGSDGVDERRVVQLPPGVSAADCPNFPFCNGAPPGGESCSTNEEEVCVAKWVNVCDSSQVFETEATY